MINTTFYPIGNSDNFENFANLLDTFDLPEREHEREHEHKQKAPKYPLHNIYQENGNDFVEVAVTGLSEDDLEIYIEDGRLIINGIYPETPEREYYHKDLSTKDFMRKFELSKNTQVGEVTVENGLLKIALEKVEPEKKLIPINQHKLEDLNTSKDVA